MEQYQGQMKAERTDLRLLLSPAFLLGLTLLLVNDFYLKPVFGNFLTGKLSDFAGLFIFPIFFCAFLTKYRRSIYILSALLFAFWKSPFSEIIIDTWNLASPFRIGRTVDYMDLIALLILPLSYFHSINYSLRPVSFGIAKRGLSFAAMVISVFAFTATSFEEDRNVYFDRYYAFDGRKEELVQQIRSLPQIHGVEFRNEHEVLGNHMPSQFIDPANYHLEFKVNEPFCDSAYLKITLYIKEENEITNANLGFIRFWCKQRPDAEVERMLLNIFEKKIVENTGLTLTPPRPKVRSDDKTPRSRP